MKALSIVSEAALAAGVPARYRYWYGHSERRHLFTETDRDSLEDFAEGVVIAVRGDRVIWAGDLGDLARLPATPWIRGAAFYVHLLAATAEARRVLADDLRPADPSHLRLAA